MSLPDGSSLADLTFSYVTGTGIIRWAYSFGSVCQYKRYVGNTLTVLSQTTPYLFYKNGGISYRGAPDTYAPLITVTALGSVAVPLTVTDFTGISAMTLSLEYDPAIMTYVNFVKNPLFVGNFQVGNNAGTGGKKIIRIQWYGTAVSLVNGAALCTLNFSYIASASTGTTLNWIDEGSSCEYAEGSGDILIDLPQNDYFHNGSVTPAPVSVSVAPSANPSCGENTVTFTATPTNGGTTPVYQWKVNGSNAGTNSSVFTYTPVNNDAVTCVLTSSLPVTSGNPATSNEVIMTVLSSVTASVSINTSTNPVCAGTSVEYTATPVNGGSSPVYQWKVNGSPVGTNSTLFSYAPANNDEVTCQMTSNQLCASGNPALSNAVTMTVFPALPASIVIIPSANPVCDGASFVTFSASPVNGGDTPTYQWMVNSLPVGSNSSTYSFTATNADVVTCQMISSNSCATGNPAMSNSVTMSVLPVLPAGITVIASANPVCAGITVTYTASPDNGGSTPVYQWMVNGSPAGTNSETFSYSPANSDMINCQMTSGDPCSTGNPALSNTITMTVYPVMTVSVEITPSLNPVCEGTSVTYNALPVNGGSLPAYQWMVNGVPVGTSNESYSYAPADNDLVTCEMTSSESCTMGNPAMSNTVTMTVFPVLPVEVTVNSSANPCCEGTSVTFTASPVNAGDTPAYLWRLNGSPVGANVNTYSYIPANNDVITCQVTSSDICATGNPALSNTVTMTVLPVLPVSIMVAPSVNPACSGIPVIFTATPENEGASPVYQWMVNGSPAGSNSTTFTYAPENNEVVKCMLTSDAQCVSGNPATSNEVVMSVGTLVSADFTADNLTPLKTDVVTFSDLSTGEGLSWNWSFDRPGAIFVNGTTYLSQNPQVKFTEGGPYTVILTTANTCFTATETKAEYVVAGTPGLWLGSTSSDWNTPSNWDNYLVPDSSTNVVIPASAVNWPVFDGDFVIGIHCGSLHLNGSTSELTITGTMTIP
jgi:hypothetical protein